MLVLLHGAKKNVGDFLIFERARALIERYRGADAYQVLPRWLPLDDHLEMVNRAEAVVWCGGPGYGPDFYPHIVPLARRLADLQVPIVPLGLGWGVNQRAADADSFRFSPRASEALRLIHQRIEMSSVRDLLTERVLRNNGVDNVVTTGCPAWYHLPSLERSFEPPARVRRIVFTTPAEFRHFLPAARMIRWLAHRFPEAEKVVVFHRGIWADDYTSVRTSLYNMALALSSELARCRVVDAAFDTRHIEFYDSCDLHVGYRVHAHIDFLSRRKPSILLQEDARSVGQSLTLGTQDIDATAADAIAQLEARVQHHLDSRFADFGNVVENMRSRAETMQQFLGSW